MAEIFTRKIHIIYCTRAIWNGLLSDEVGQLAPHVSW